MQWKSGSKALGSDEIEDTPHKSARWLYTEEAAQDPDLSAVVETRCYLPSSQVDAKVFAGWETEIVINGIKADNHLILAIPITEFPTRIDAIMEEFREALLHELIKRTTFAGENIDKAESFYASAFANTLSHHTCLIDSFGGIQMVLLGLWAWDLVQREEETAERVSDAVRKGMEDLKIKLGKPPGILIPEPDSIRKNGYDKVVATVGSASGTQRKPKSSRVDRYLTSSRSVVLGPVG
ncbi:hypothetical protein [Paraburkholderia caribensis]|uniref:hypothetical protein n=1 Tax=Paraburkholderia caribensis TaxID=75105 RepID=UPI0011E012A2|nr:hypothetical protein [Paraburkholderia caribensis]